MAESPTAAFILSLIGGIFYLIVGGLVAAAATFIGAVTGMMGFGLAGAAVATVGAVGFISGIVMIIGAAMMNSPEKSKVRTGSILVLIFTLVGALFTFGGFVVGFILGLIGSIMGLTWNPPAATPAPAQTA